MREKIGFEAVLWVYLLVLNPYCGSEGSVAPRNFCSNIECFEAWKGLWHNLKDAVQNAVT